MFERFQRKAPALEQPISLGAASTKMLLREFMELPLHIERANRLPILKIDNPTSRGISRNIARALYGIVEDKVSRQAAFFEKGKHACCGADF